MLVIKNLTKKYSEKNVEVEAIKSLSLKVKNGTFVVFIGPSGCGKTTLLKIIAGLLKPSSGEININGKKVSHADKDKGMMFQNFALFPWLTVEGNIKFGLNLNKKNKKDVERIVNKYLQTIGLENFRDTYPKSLSGGMQQRVAIARMLVNNPKVLLMDEPFGSLDIQTRLKMQKFLTNLLESNRKTVIFVTHDVEEAIFLGNTIYVFSQRPSKIKTVFDIPFSYPRLEKIKYSKKFIKLKKEIFQEL